MRRAGILLHPTSLPGAGPCGTLGRAAHGFLDWLQLAGCTLWQILPLNPTGGGFSPYDSPGSHALGTHLVCLERLVRDGLLAPHELNGRPDRPHRADPDAVASWHTPLVRLAAARLAQTHPAALAAFAEANPWVVDWALFEVLRERHPGDGWWDFPPALRDAEPEAVCAARQSHASAIAVHVAAQVLVRRQWDALRVAAHERGIRIVGDLPIFVSGAGADTWLERDLFRYARTAEGRWQADPVAGVPPDYFAPEGQCWGNPLYDWAAHATSGFGWWTERFRATFAVVDAVRVDHFRGFAAAWEIPSSAGGDARRGSWEPGPGRALFDAVRDELGPLGIIAEDLGHITPDVEALRDDLGVPGMKVLQFAFGGSNDHAFLPHTWSHPRWVAYTGTHDNDTSLGWYRNTDEATRHRLRVYVGRDGHDAPWDLIRLAWSSTASWAITPLQDVLALGSEARMNTPGLAVGNWCWRAPELPTWAAERLRNLTDTFGRLPTDTVSGSG